MAVVSVMEIGEIPPPKATSRGASCLLLTIILLELNVNVNDNNSSSRSNLQYVSEYYRQALSQALIQPPPSVDWLAKSTHTHTFVVLRCPEDTHSLTIILTIDNV
jgi:hypothetical protein